MAYERIIISLLLSLFAGNAFAEYRAPNLPELARFSAIAPEAPLPQSGPVIPPSPLPPGVKLPAGLTPDMLAALRANPALVPGFKPPGNKAYQDLHGAASAGGNSAAREDAVDSLRSSAALDSQLQKVRKMLADTETPAAAPAPAPIPVVEAPPPPAPVDVQPAHISRLLNTVQSGRQRAEMEARIAVVKDNLGKKDPSMARLSNATGGTAFQASLEFNSAVRGSTRGAKVVAGTRLLAQRRLLAASEGNPDQIMPTRSEKAAAARADKRAGSVLGFSADPPKFVDPDGEVPDSLLMRHRPVYTDNAVKEEAPKAVTPVTPTEPGEGGGRHKLTYTSATVGAYEGGGDLK